MKMATSSYAGPDRHEELEEGGAIPRVGSRLYTRREYWESRFAAEEEHEWLAGWGEPTFRAAVEAAIPKDARILLVGTGNSTLPMDMAISGYSRITASDYSETVVRKMAQKCASLAAAGTTTTTSASASPMPPSPLMSIAWEVQDMTNLSYPDASFDAVLDKAALDAILADGGDVWDPPSNLLASAHAVCASVARVLVPGGIYMQLSFSQPHFRRKYLLQPAQVAGGAAPEGGGGGGGGGNSISVGASLVSDATARECSNPDAGRAGAGQAPSAQEAVASSSLTAGSAEGLEDDEDEWEPDLNPDIVPGGGASSPPSVEGTLWGEFAAVNIPAGFGYYLYVMKKAKEA
jgi:hypothetical protein